MNSNKYRQFIPSYGAIDIKDKKRGIDFYINYMLNRTSSIFRYENLPDSLPQKFLELYLQRNGVACVAEHEGKLYVFFGGIGGQLDEYYRPTTFVVANPYLKLFKSFTIDDDCVLLFSDTLGVGLVPLFKRYASQLVENDISIRTSMINSRMTSLITAGNDKDKIGADEYLKKIEQGDIGIIMENRFLEGIKTQPYSSTSNHRITDLIELQQYLKASWYNDIGLNANFNMKRESINSTETELNRDCLLPLIDDMLKVRMEGIEKINLKFGTNITVHLNSVWEMNAHEIRLVDDILPDDFVSSDSGVSLDGSVLPDDNVSLDGSVLPDSGVSLDGSVLPDGGVIPDVEVSVELIVNT